MGKLKWPKYQYKYNDTVYKDLLKRTKPKGMTPKTLFWFGKYRGKTLKWVQENDPNYVEWCLEENIIIILPTEQSEIEEYYKDKG